MREFIKLPVRQRQLFHFGVVNYFARRGRFGVSRQRLRRYIHDFALRIGNLLREVFFQCLRDRQRDAGKHGLFEAGRHRGDSIRTRNQLANLIAPTDVGGYRARDGGCGVGHHHCRSLNNPALNVCHYALNRRRGLRLGRPKKAQRENTEQEQVRYTDAPKQ